MDAAVGVKEMLIFLKRKRPALKETGWEKEVVTN
jgi:hypothetical protein